MQLGTSAIADLAITNAKVSNLDAGSITTGNISADRMKVNSIQAINDNTGTVKIAASKVEIDGTAVFNSISSKVDNAITNKGYQTANDVNSIVEDKGYALNSDLTTEINQRKAQYATSSTDAGTQAKTATCSNFSLYTGASITVTFSKANTHATPTLNVNSTGAKSIKSYTGAALSAA